MKILMVQESKESFPKNI